jgi:outer membrane immunogenic protein
MKTSVAAGAAVLVLTAVGAANAADMPVKAPRIAPAAPVSSWTGFYIGINGGGAWGRKCWTLTGTVPTIVGLPLPGNEGCHNTDGGIFGGQIGYNWQSGALVFGLEAQGNWARLDGRNVSLLPSPPFPASTNHTRVDGLALFTGRLGYASGPALFYVKGGAAAVWDKYDFVLTGTVVPAGVGSETRWGGTIGGGIEYKFTQNWSGAVEYNYLAMGTSSITLDSQPVNALVDVRQHLHLLTARINYSF